MRDLAVLYEHPEDVNANSNLRPSVAAQLGVAPFERVGRIDRARS